MNWVEPTDRDMPWVGEKDPYRVWLSEVILQQTTVDQGRPYYIGFVKAFPTVAHLARAREDRVLRMWQGLGYYSRARNLHRTAKVVMSRYRCRFPKDFETLLTLPGIGNYTAAAISSFTANEPRAVVDGNVIRVLARYFGIQDSVTSATGRKRFDALATALLDPALPGRYNQALMNFGALQCRPRNPKCDLCPLKRTCVALKTKTVEQLPVKVGPASRKARHFNYIVASTGGKLLLQKRTDNDIWRGLYQFPLIETKAATDPTRLVRSHRCQKLLGRVSLGTSRVTTIKQVLSHQVIYGRFIEVRATHLPVGFTLVHPTKLYKFAFPRLLTSFLEKSKLF